MILHVSVVTVVMSSAYNFMNVSSFILFFQKRRKVYCIYSYFNCCSSAVFCLFSPPHPNTSALLTSLPSFHPPFTFYCPCVLYNCSCNPSPFSPEIPSPLPSGHCPPVLNFNIFGYILLVCLFC